ncbi:hypothetical protein CY658_06235 [Variovorax sp. RO1]|uniref:hypothetical protein n=1 Tax=Variovorax sp. RO1 TaxID=2066034 RepID=UPI000C717712|nr:hypothetical protein [Variovorax sp. RO1]PLC06615.1 hypothetical protein CY658_06235 [Variovorax sp. RO1]
MSTLHADPRAIACASFWQALSDKLESLQSLSGPALVGELNALLQPFFPNLAAEVLGDPPAFTLVLTAHGAEADFEDLMALVRSAPPLPQVAVEAFRQRMREGFSMRMNDFELASSDVLVKHEPYRGRVALELGFAKPIPMDMQDHARHMSLIMLDHILGEYDFAVKVGPVDHVEADAQADFEGVPLDDFVALFDACWRDDLGHTGVFPAGEHGWSGLTATRTADDGSEVEAVVMRNDAANALLGRADLGHRLSAAVPVESGEELDEARVYEDRLTALLQTHGEGCCTHIVLEEGVRTVHFHVADPQVAIAHAQSVQDALELPVTLALAFDPTWKSYRTWLA